MYTQCPKCEAMFRITVDVLQQARGQVLCGSCETAFNALDHLSEEPPTTLKRDPGPASAEEEDLERSQLLETLDRLAGNEDVRIEDTGVEWRVVDDDENGDADASSMRWVIESDDDAEEQIPDTAKTAENELLHESLAAAQEEELEQEPEEEPRYDDNTLLPDDFEERHQHVAATPTPQRRASDRFEFVVEDEADDSQPDLELSEPGDWSDLLDDLGEGADTATDDAGAEDAPDSAAEDAPDSAEEAAAVAAEETAEEAAEETLEAGEEDAAPQEAEQPAAEDDAEQPAAGDDAEQPATAEDAETAAEDPLDEAAAPASGDDAEELAAGMGPDPDPEQEIAMVASQLDELLDTMGVQALKEVPDDADDAGEASADDGAAEFGEADEPAPEDRSGEQAIPYAALEDEDEDAAALKTDDDRTDDDRTDDDAAEADAAETTPADEDERSDSDAAAAEAEALELDDADVPDIDAAATEADREEPAGDTDTDAEERPDGPPDDSHPPAAEEPEDAADAEPAQPEEDGSEDDLAAMTGSMGIDADMLRAMQDADFAATMVQEDGSPMVETIIMEGDHVSAALANREPAGGLEKLTDPGSLLDTYITNRDADGNPPWWSQKRARAAAAVLLVLLIVQVVHYSRESLATIGAFNQAIAPIYRLLGDPITPTWDIRGWQFEATNGSTDESDSVLTIYSRLSNRTDGPLPYPLVHVALTDRFEEIIGSRMLEPDEYLAGNADPSRTVAAGANFTAVITIASPAAEATGFKLNVCYPADSDQVRCAIEDFKTP